MDLGERGCCWGETRRRGGKKNLSKDAIYERIHFLKKRKKE